VKYVNGLVTEIGKRTRVFLWTGDCDPDAGQVELTYELEVFNVNGGDTFITEAEPFLYRVSPMGVDYSPFFQVYAPVQNENIYTNLWTEPKWGYILYTNLWTEPKWGYIRAIQTFELTERPRRLKPISIYYHFYSAQEVASLNALRKVYRYALSREVTPMYLSEYAARVLDFRDTAILETEGGFRIKNSGYIRTLRLSKDIGYPDLMSTNAITESYRRTSRGFELELRAYMPLEIEIDTGICDVKIDKLPVKRGKVHFRGELNAKVEAVCPMLCFPWISLKDFFFMRME